MLNANDPASWNILLVDDDTDNRTVLAHIMRFYDATVTDLPSGGDALNSLEKWAGFNLVLLDLQMPAVDGWMVLKAMRSHANPLLQTVPIIAITAHAMHGDREKGLAAGFNGYLIKPVDPFTLLEDITKILIALNKESSHEPHPESSAS